MKNIIKALFILFALLQFTGVPAQELNPVEVKEALEKRQFIFKAQTAFAMGGQSRQLTPGYDLTISGDSLTTYLPYFGRAYAAPMPGEGAIRLQLTGFDYKAKQKRKGWEILIDPENGTDVTELVMRVFDNGRATLMVNSNNRQSISFNGYIVSK